MCLRLLTSFIIVPVKMKIITVIVLYLCIIGSTMHVHESFNVLVPNNDVNMHAKLKEILQESDKDTYELDIKDYVEKIADHDNLSLLKPINSLEKESPEEKNEGKSITNTTENTWWTTTTTVSTTTNKQVIPFEGNCLLGKVSDSLRWVNAIGVLQTEYIFDKFELNHLQYLDLSGILPNESYHGIEDIVIMSLGYNDLKVIPEEVVDASRLKLKYLSLVGNDFKDLKTPINLRNLKELDLRSCNLITINSELLQMLNKLEYLYLSYNNIINLGDNSFKLPSLIYLDLSYNKEKVQHGDLPNPLILTLKVFDNLKLLQFLDLSYTKIEVKSISALNSLSSTLIGISLCYTELFTSTDNFLSNLTSLKYLDVSGNSQLNFTKIVFTSISSSLEVLHAKDANINRLDWTKPLTNLRILNLSDNKIRNWDNNSFSHMLYLKDLNLEKNSLGNWYTRLFSQNQELETLNIRENTLTLLTDDMMEDMLSVRYLAVGRNQFECSCSFHNFMLILFEATKNANITNLYEKFNLEFTNLECRIRSNGSSRDDIIARVYEKNFRQILTSIEALKSNNYKRHSKSLLSLSELKSINDSVFHTILLDYDENNEDYQCMNVTEKQRQSMLDLIDLCDEQTHNTNNSPYLSIDDIVIITLSTSIPLVIISFILMSLIYWKWWYIRYFCILCKNSAILTFMDDDDGKKEIVERQSINSIDYFLYDVFVSYSDYNRSWVLDELIPNIEKRESINVCLHERDFTVGHGILENIISCMDRSRCLLLLISNKFLESQWCQFEMNLAQHRLLETRKEKLIVAFLEDVPIRSQPKTLKYLIRTKTYIKWPQSGSNDEKQLFWKRLKKSIISSKWEHESYGSMA